MRIVAELINVEDGEHAVDAHVRPGVEEHLCRPTEIAEAVAGSLKLTLLGTGNNSASVSTPSAEAHNAYLEGHFYFQRRNLEDYRKAITFFDQAIQIDPKYALAYAERAEAWTWSGIECRGSEAGLGGGGKRCRDCGRDESNLAEAYAAFGMGALFR